MRKIFIYFFLLTSAFNAFSSGTPEKKEAPANMTVIQTGAYFFQAAVMGSPGDLPVILLHGFPETSFMWHNLQALLAENGFYSIAPDQRGYSPEARPIAEKEYAIDLLAADVIAIADSLGLEKFHLIGHDWGSAVGWAVAASYPGRLLSWTALSIPHLDAFAGALATDPEQHEASGYMRLFQWPLIPEIYLKAGGYKALKAIWEKSSPKEIEAYMTVFSGQGALTAALNWYRANYNTLTKGETILPKVSVPTLFIWGINDPAVLKSGAESNFRFVTGSYTEHFIDAGHWLIQESFPEVSGLILEHISRMR